MSVGMKPQMKYKVRAGTIDSGKKYEYKVAALVSLRTIFNEEDMWISSNADGLGAFDDFILHQGNKTFMIQLKHKDDPKPLVQREFLAQKGDFILKKYFQDSIKLKGLLEFQGKKPDIINYLGSLKNISFVLFTNRSTKPCEFLKESLDMPSFLNTDSTNGYEINFDKVPDLPNADYSDIRMYLLPNQIHAKLIDLEISKEIQKLAHYFKIKHLCDKQIAVKFTKYIADWAEGNLGGHYCLTKFDIIAKLTELFSSQYEIKLKPETFSYPSCNKRQAWNDIIKDKTLTVVDFQENVLKFLLNYLAHEVGKYCNDSKTWNEIFSNEAQTTFYQNNPSLKLDMLKIVGNHGKITVLDVYKCLWMNKQIPILLEINNVNQYEDILQILKLSKYNYSFIIINNCEETFQPIFNENISANYFITLEDLNLENRKRILLQEVKVQGRLPVTLETLLEEDMLHYVKCKDIINILLGDFNIGNNLNSLPEYFISRSISKVFLLSNVLERVQDEIFLIETTSNNFLTTKNYANVHKLESMNVNKLNRGGIVFTSKTATLKEIEKLKSTKRPVHRLKIYNENYLEWKSSFGSVRSLRDFQINLEDITESCIINKIDSPINIIQAIPGMGKSILMDSVALQTPVNKWVLKIDLNGHQSYYKSNLCKSSNTKALQHLEYFKNSLSHDMSELSNAVFRKLSKTKDIILLLDGFDEISLLYKTEVTNIAKSLCNEGFSVWITTRPYMSSHLETELETFSMDLKSFSIKDQKEFLTNYFCAENSLNTKLPLIQDFVKQLLEASKKNLNDWDTEFTGIPLQTKLLADAFKVDCENYISNEGKCKFNQNFDLLYLYQTFIDKKIDILCKKFGPSAEDNRFIIKEHQSSFAIKHLFAQHENLMVYQYVTEEFNAYYENYPDRIQLLQREGIVTVDCDFNVNFVHRTYGEYLAALWLTENLNSNSSDKKELAHILIKERFTTSYKFLFGLFDRILSNGFPLHLAIINNQHDKILELINSEEISKNDASGRSILHLLALYSLQFPPLFEAENFPPYIISFKGLRFVNSKEFEKDPMSNTILKILKSSNTFDCNKTDLVGYTPLDYALANQSLSVAHYILVRGNIKSWTINSNICVKLKRNHVIYCALLYYGQLLHALLKYFACKELLFNIIDRNELCDCYIKDIFDVSYSDALYNIDGYNISIRFFSSMYEQRYKEEAMLQFLEPTIKGHWIGYTTEYSDIRYAICFGSEANVNNLLMNGIQANQSDYYYNTLLHYAVLRTNPNIVDMIFSKFPDTDVNKQNIKKNTPLHLAFSTRNNEENSFWSFLSINKIDKIVNTLIKMKANPNIKNEDNVTAFHLAVTNRKCDWVKLFISNDADVNIQDSKGNNALHIAVINDFHDVLTVILTNTKNININMQNNEGETPLFYSIRNNNLDSMRLLLDKGADVTIQNIYGETILHIIVTYGYNDVLREILNGNKIDNIINVTDNYGWTPFACALFNNKIETVRILVDNGANLDNLNEKGKNLLEFAITGGYKNLLSAVLANGSSIDINRQDKNGRTPLFNAVKAKDLERVLQLLKLEAKIDVKDNNGVTVLHLLASGDCIEFNDAIISILNKNFVDIDGNMKDNDGRTPLFYAIENNQKSTVQLLKFNGADIHIRDNDGTSYFHLMASKGHNEMLNEILTGNKRININIQDNAGRTPLHLAIMEDHQSTVQTLLSFKTVLNIRDKDGTSPLHLLASKGFIEVLKSLSTSSCSVDVNIQDNDGRTPLHCAIEDSRRIMARLFLSKHGDFHVKDKDGVSAIHLIAGWGYDDVLHSLFVSDRNINFNIQDNDGRTPVFYATLHNHSNARKLLLSFGTKVNRPNS